MGVGDDRTQENGFKYPQKDREGKKLNTPGRRSQTDTYSLGI